MLKLTSADPKRAAVDALIIPVCEDQPVHNRPVLKALVAEAEKIPEFKGKTGDRVTLYHTDTIKSPRVILMGLGKKEEIDLEAVRGLAGKAVKQGIQAELSKILVAVPQVESDKLKAQDLVSAMMEGACLGNHLFDQYKKEKKQKPLKQVSFLVPPKAVKSYSDLPERIETICESAAMARDWVSTPSNDKTPEQFAGMISSEAKKAGLKVTVLNEKQLKAQGFGAILAVGAGSKSSPRLVILEHNPKGAEKTVAFVGKGVTFDSGGINLKPTASLADMKCDMAGAAAAAGAMMAIGRMAPKIRVIGLMPLVENMPSGDATRTGDIIKTYEGKTVEIGNTDAEGRLILIDALAYANATYKPDVMIDLATLTGACMIALGEKIAGLFTTDDKLAEAISASGEKTFERCWRLPLPDDYKELLKSDFADIHNMSSSRYGGAVTAALFLSEFVGKTPWAHIDIAGPAYAKKANSYCGAGGTGFGVRLLCDLLEKL